MKSEILPPIIKEIPKLYHKVITIEEIKKFISITTTPLPDTKIYKIMYHLRSKGYLISCKKDLFYIKSPLHQIQEEEIITKRYRKLLYQHCTEDCTTNRYIGGISALEILSGLSYFNMDEVIIINSKKAATETICFDKKIIYKNYNSNKESLFTITKKYTQTISVGTSKCKHANLELALLETLYSPPRAQQAYINQFIHKIIKKNKKILNWSVFETIIKQGKFHSSFNRLYKIMQDSDPTGAQQLHALIKRYSYIIDL